MIPALGAEGAARVYARLLAHTVEQVRQSELPFELRVTGGEANAFAELYGDVPIVEQGEGDLGARMARVDTPNLIIGSDCPGLNAAVLQAAAEVLDEREAVLGPATDGGYYLIGLTRPMPFLFEDMAWGTPSVFAQTLQRLVAQGVPPAILPELSDIDMGEDLARWPDFQ